MKALVPAQPAGASPRRLHVFAGRIGRSGATQVLAAFAASIAIGLALLALLGRDPLSALAVMLDGAFGSPRAVADTLVFMAPRLLTALAALVALRCGFFNLGGEGQLQLGAVGAILPSTVLPRELGPLLLPLSILSAALCGALWGLIPAVLKLWRGANEIITTLMLNFVGIYLVKYLVQGPLQPPGSDFNMSAKVPDGAMLRILLPGTRLHAGVLLAVAAAAAVWALLYRTTYGARLRAAGLAPGTARLLRLPTRRLVVSSMLLSGALAGVGGAIEVLGVQYRLIDGFSVDMGFDGLAIALLGGLDPIGAAIVALYFGAIDSGTLALQSAFSVSAALAQIMASLPIIVLACLNGYKLLKGRPLWSSTR